MLTFQYYIVFGELCEKQIKNDDKCTSKVCQTEIVCQQLVYSLEKRYLSRCTWPLVHLGHTTYVHRP